MEEIWKPIEGYENYYEISNKGRLRSVDRVVQDKNGVKMPIKGRLIKCGTCQGYKIYNLYKGGKYKSVRIHRLVAQAFIPNPENKSDVNHKDFDRSNNCVENLEWTTRQENCKWSSENYSKCRLGRKIPHGRYKENLKREMHHIHKKGDKYGHTYYQFVINKDQKVITKSFKNLDDAISYRDKFFEEIGGA